jgi:hypothetical protein
MTATNHALTGAIIGAIVANPWLALVLALTSHFALDAIPHFGVGKGSNAFIKSRRFAVILVIDTALCAVLVASLAIAHPHLWWFMAICAFVATSPDLASINRWRHARQGKLDEWKPSLYVRFASKIQWFERPIGGVVEAVWFISALTVLVSILRARS